MPVNPFAQPGSLLWCINADSVYSCPDVYTEPEPTEPVPVLDPEKCCVSCDGGEPVLGVVVFDTSTVPPTETIYVNGSEVIGCEKVPCPVDDWEATPHKPICLADGSEGYCAFSFINATTGETDGPFYVDPFGVIVDAVDLPAAVVPCVAAICTAECGPVFEPAAAVGVYPIPAGTASDISVVLPCDCEDTSAKATVTIDCNGEPKVVELDCNGPAYTLSPEAIINFDVTVEVLDGAACIETYLKVCS